MLQPLEPADSVPVVRGSVAYSYAMRVPGANVNSRLVVEPAFEF